MRAFVVSLPFCLLLTTAFGQQAEPSKTPPQRPADANALFAQFRKMPGLEASYREEKHLGLLAVPLKSSGRLFFLGPGYLRREVRAPEKSTLLITPDELRVQDRDGTETIDLRRSDRLRLFVTSLVRVFAGEEKALTRHYALQFVPDARSTTDWRLLLTPRDESLQRMIKQLVLHGRGFGVRRLEVHEPNGDRTVTVIEKADPRRKFSAAEKKALFGIEPVGTRKKAR